MHVRDREAEQPIEIFGELDASVQELTELQLAFVGGGNAGVIIA